MSVTAHGTDETGGQCARSFQKAAGVLRVGPGAEHRRTWPAWSSRADAGETPAVCGGDQSPDEGLACAEAGVVREGRPQPAGFTWEQPARVCIQPPSNHLSIEVRRCPPERRRPAQVSPGRAGSRPHLVSPQTHLSLPSTLRAVLRVPLDWAVDFCAGRLRSHGTSGHWPLRSREERGRGGLALGQGQGW